jgi:hypothetical protein
MTTTTTVAKGLILELKGLRNQLHIYYMALDVVKNTDSEGFLVTAYKEVKVEIWNLKMLLAIAGNFNGLEELKGDRLF